MLSGKVLCAGYSTLLLLALFSATSHGFVNSCGEIHNIRFPFQLKGDPNNTCGDTNYTLSCDNNRTVLTLYSGEYFVNAIDYYSKTMTLVDVGIQSNVCSSFPIHSLTATNFSWRDPFRISIWSLIAFLDCVNPVKSPFYVNRSSYCDYGVDLYSYVIAGDLRILDIADSCRVETMVLSSMMLTSESTSNFSLLDVNRALGFGFDVSWEFPRCIECRKRASCFGNSLNVTATCSGVCSFKPSFLSKLQTYLRQVWYYRYLVLLCIGAIILARFLCAPCVFGFLIYKYRRRHLSTFDTIEGFLRSQNNLVPITYSYSDLKKMTKGFRDKLGQGGYGSVFKGKLRSGDLVAVKMLSNPKADGQEFINEVATIGRIHHVNVVRLIGYCAKNSKRALVYDFMPNGSLEKYIFCQDGKFSLSFEQMYKISLGVARGIEYLHQGCDMQILHFDIKPHNILLDENFTPKVSDFGLAKLYPTDDSIVTLTAARGTLGYMAPELFYKNIGGVSYKADIYSFGMLLMEMAGRRKNWNEKWHVSNDSSSQTYFPSWVYDQFAEGRHIEMGETTEEEHEMVKKMMIVALWCIQMKPSNRPSMNKVVEMLEGSIESLQMPPKPFLYPQERPAVTNSSTASDVSSSACTDSTISVSN
ncbi:LEAF RUST 10 DISEASE-RESISTANCE LOCUS RECEPTOR-LIKE PROTEIN KINASE-like 2.3 [Actinidia eriantha]|uniref:LEAF RUST 10 DISEASE-RESISTANCE LOCUS RECEPTOR-LIKE PROTEIN KINASE-like 2.3 n=1 Tax=Actinidia eriantha TaxID=165200 RepID=UPI00258EE62A|nr:LEAF RUST 10 DISEASE-RESISTANCE LOCUS RECEPTOR-LIKE PROTEIN KINASE-like 2.3 [Actinidia eriantha]